MSEKSYKRLLNVFHMPDSSATFISYLNDKDMLLVHLLKDQCPVCHEGKVFQNSNLFSFRAETMNKECPVCHLDFNKEPGFYWGSMYASYALAVLEAFMTYIICRIFGTGAFVFLNLWIIIGVMLVLSPFNFRMARLIWLYIFPKS